MKTVWFIYILECVDGTYYTGITNDFKKRYRAHIEGKGAKYTKGRGPFIVRYLFMLPTQSQALKREIEIKKKTKAQKTKMINYWAGVEKSGEHTEHTRWLLFELMSLLTEQGWTTKNELDDSDINSTYMLWYKGDKTLYVGNYYLQSEEGGVLAWKDHDVEESDIVNFLNEC